MFGYLIADRNNLTEEEFSQYRAAYCGICARLRENGLLRGTVALSYDLVFLWMVLTSMYEPESVSDHHRCPVHPFRGADMTENKFSRYCADIGTILAYYKALDDWRDDRDVVKMAVSKLLSSSFEDASARLPRQSRTIKESLDRISMLEEAQSEDIDALCNSFGTLLGEIFVFDEDDHWSPHLRAFGESVGRYLYLLDAVVDLEDDISKKRYNPLIQSRTATEEWQNSALDLFLGDISELYNYLPLVQYTSVISSVIYSGMTEKLREKRGAQKSGEDNES